MRSFSLLLALLILTKLCSASEALGINYDDVYIVRLKHPKQPAKKDHRILLHEDFSQEIISSFKIQKRFHKKIDQLFNKKNNFDNGLADSRLQLYALIFYKDKKPVLSIAPNLMGGDLYATDKKELTSRSLSIKQRDQFLNIVFVCLSRGSQTSPLPIKPVVK